MEIIELDRNNLAEIENLWKDLNEYHIQHSSTSKSYFEKLTFQEKLSQWLNKEKLALFVSLKERMYVGYCVVTVEKNVGEVSSIYVKENYRGQGIGDALMRRAMTWLNTHYCDEIVIYVAEGNEKVFRFYKKYGFEKRFTVLAKGVQ